MTVLNPESQSPYFFLSFLNNLFWSSTVRLSSPLPLLFGPGEFGPILLAEIIRDTVQLRARVQLAKSANGEDGGTAKLTSLGWIIVGSSRPSYPNSLQYAQLSSNSRPSSGGTGIFDCPLGSITHSAARPVAWVNAPETSRRVLHPL